MVTTHIRKFLGSFQAGVPIEADRFLDWAQNKDSIDFMTSRQTDFLVFASLPHVFIDTFLIGPHEQDLGWESELPNWNFGSTAGWYLGYELSGDKELRAWLEESQPFFGSKKVRQVEHLVFERFRPALPTSIPYLELNQRFTQAMDLHPEDDSNSYVKVNIHGDFDYVVQINQVQDGHYCTVNSELLALYMLATKQVLVRVFDLHRCSDWAKLSHHHFVKSPPHRIDTSGLQGEIRMVRDEGAIVGSLLRGSQLFPSLVPTSTLVESLNASRITGKPSVSFLAQELSSGRVGYFPPNGIDSPPLDHLDDSISPAFFRPEVLSKYKQHPDKYEVSGSSISCRGSWWLRSYYVNDAGQVFAYLKDLWSFPWSEQMYWKSFNERPKAGISKTAFQQDFLVEWPTDPDPSRDLTHALQKLGQVRVGQEQTAIWTLQDDPHVHAHIQDLMMNSLPDWRDHINGLAKALVEGFQISELRFLLSATLGRPLEKEEKQWGSLTVLKKWLLSSGVENGLVDEIMSPFFKLQALRSEDGVAHRGGKHPPGDLRSHYQALLSDLATSVTRLIETVDGFSSTSQ